MKMPLIFLLVQEILSTKPCIFIIHFYSVNHSEECFLLALYTDFWKDNSLWCRFFTHFYSLNCCNICCQLSHSYYCENFFSPKMRFPSATFENKLKIYTHNSLFLCTHTHTHTHVCCMLVICFYFKFLFYSIYYHQQLQF